MDQTGGIDKTKPLIDQIVQLLDKRYYVEDVGILGGRFQHHKKVAAGILSLIGDKNAETIK